ncbi:hypothetical protein LLG39_04195, partial [bacterium]|nr:hypothetical protein [bacterium]
MTTEQPIPVLDDVARLQTVDKRNMLRLVNELPEQCETALGIGRSFSIEPLESVPNVVFITGVGSSGVAADMAVAAVSGEISIPVVADHGGKLPAYVGEQSLVIIVDYAGKSEASLRSYKDARQRGANVICVASGGALLEAASKDGIKAFKIPPG